MCRSRPKKWKGNWMSNAKKKKRRESRFLANEKEIKVSSALLPTHTHTHAQTDTKHADAQAHICLHPRKHQKKHISFSFVIVETILVLVCVLRVCVPFATTSTFPIPISNPPFFFFFLSLHPPNFDRRLLFCTYYNMHINIFPSACHFRVCECVCVRLFY